MNRYIDHASRKITSGLGRARSLLRDFLVEDGFSRKESHPAMYKSYLKRQTGKSQAWFPPIWGESEAASWTDHSRVAVVIHVFFPDLLVEIISDLKNIPVEFDVLVTNASGTQIDAERFRVGNARNICVLEVENRGRDIFPLVQLANAGFLDPYEMVAKVHTKKSVWREKHPELRGDGKKWNDELLGSLLGSTNRVSEILSSFALDSTLGSVTADGNVLGSGFWGGDEALTMNLGYRLERHFESDTLRFSAGSMYWIRAFLVQGLRSLNLSPIDFDDEMGQSDGTTAHAIERLLGLLTVEAGLRVETVSYVTETVIDSKGRDAWTRWNTETQVFPAARVIPFYLPQFHPFEENDRWWGKGFTEWDNVAAAVPVFEGQNVPLLPSELGFYDLRMDEVRTAQAKLATAMGIEGFMYYYYWFAGNRLMSTPIEKLREQDGLSQPFCIMWANENWTRAWDGRDSDVLIEQDYDNVPAEEFIDDVMEFLVDPRYIKVDGKPIVAVYRPAQMNNFVDVADVWRKKAAAAGLPGLVLLAVETSRGWNFEGHFSQWGLDGVLGFPPHGLPWKPAPAHRVPLDTRFRGNFVDYRQMAQAAITKAYSLNAGEYPGIMVNFGNTARRQWTSDVWWGSNPYTFHRWMRESVRAVMDREYEQRLVFVNAWNEWAESAVLEPTQRFGRTYLLAVRNVIYS